VRYCIRDNIVIKTENAAKPVSQASQYLKELISGLGHVGRSFDYGCGKLRYLNGIAKTSDRVVLVDSEVQITRRQKLYGRMQSAAAAVRKSNRISLINTKQFLADVEPFDRGYCINVLSVVPILSLRKVIVDRIYAKLRHGGEAIFVVQYRNSDFKRMLRLPNSKRWRRGILMNSLRGYSYYGFISPKELTTMVAEAGFSDLQLSLNEGSAYVVAKK